MIDIRRFSMVVYSTVRPRAALRGVRCRSHHSARVCNACYSILMMRRLGTRYVHALLFQHEFRSGFRTSLNAHANGPPVATVRGATHERLAIRLAASGPSGALTGLHR